MVNQCCVPRCESKAKRSTKRFHRFPRDVEMCRLWLLLMNHRLSSTAAVTRDSVKHLRVCSDHFSPEDYRRLSLNNALKSSAVPSVFPWSPPSSSRAQDQNLSLKDEPSPALGGSQPDHKFSIDLQRSAPSCPALARRMMRSEGRRQKVVTVLMMMMI
ncbi:THAP domain-containing protein 1-like [Salminus brasiliensis]|uniref:THAP domain-containing protein 1-like n=1 Tax=Salminus brasiliensis TaxID=930266 RepID=UPI003B8343A1